MTILLGAIADDFTGATDLCNALVSEGMRTVQIIGVPDATTNFGDADAVVVALKTRTAATKDAVAQSRASCDWLTKSGATQIVEKYCSTFDSTAQGNIGPITDALLNQMGARAAVICPAFPENGRTVYQGHLFVWENLLSDSSMKDHPLTPMRESSLPKLIEAQGEGQAGVVPLQVVHQGVNAIRAAIDHHIERGIRYIVIDALNRDDLRKIGSALQDHTLITGGSGIALGLPNNFRLQNKLAKPVNPKLPKLRARKLVLAGSCSTATRAQIDAVKDDWPIRKIDIDAVADGRSAIEDLCQWAIAQDETKPVLIYGSANSKEIHANQQKYGMEQAGEMIETAVSKIAENLTGNGFGTLIVAGGESSGAVVSSLGIKALRIGPEIAPGVPWTETIGDMSLTLALKSGNFGARNFFKDAFGMLQ